MDDKQLEELINSAGQVGFRAGRLYERMALNGSPEKDLNELKSMIASIGKVHIIDEK